MKVITRSDNTPSYLTKGKYYEVLSYDDISFEIIDDMKDRTTCRFKECPNLLWIDNWHIVLRPNQKN